MIKKIGLFLAVLLLLLVALVYALGLGYLGTLEVTGLPLGERLPDRILAQRAERQQAAASRLSGEPAVKQTLVEVYSGHGNSERWIDNQAWRDMSPRPAWICGQSGATAASAAIASCPHSITGAGVLPSICWR